MGERDNGCNHYFIRPKAKWNGGEWSWDFSNREPIPLPDGVEEESLLLRLSNRVLRRLREMTHFG